MKVKTPLISVIVTCYNHEDYIIQCLNSVLNQSYSAIELIIIDAHSKDESARIIENWINSIKMRVVFIKQPSTYGICKNINTGLEIANGQFIQVLAGDDYLDQNKFERYLNEYAKHPHKDAIGFMYSGVIKVDGNNNTINKKPSIVPVDHNENYFKQLLSFNFVYAPSALIVKDKLDQVGWYDEQLYFNDWDMWLRLSKQFKVFFIKDYYSAFYRVISTSMTFNKPIEFHISTFTIFYKLWKKGVDFNLVFNQIQKTIINWAYSKGKVRGRAYLTLLKLFPKTIVLAFNKYVASKTFRDK